LQGDNEELEFKTPITYRRHKRKEDKVEEEKVDLEGKDDSQSPKDGSTCQKSQNGSIGLFKMQSQMIYNMVIEEQGQYHHKN